jgi:hypothetical protein
MGFAMVPKADHFVPLLCAVARLHSSSYEARGVIYDRALSELLARLRTTEPPCTEADIDRELLAFRAAVRRVEFGDMDEQDRIARQGIEERAQYLASRREARQAAASAPVVAEPPESEPAAPKSPLPESPVPEPLLLEPLLLEPPLPEPPLPEPAVVELAAMGRRRSVAGRIAGRMVLAVALVALGLAGYAYEAGQIDASLLNRIAPVAWLAPGGGATEPTEPATYYERAVSDAPWRELAGSARWRARIEDASIAAHKPVLALDLRVPERELSMTMSIRHEAAEDAAITHLIELRFTNPQGAALDAISSVTGISMRRLDGSSAHALAGLSIKAAPGLFLFGLSAESDDARRNAEALQTLARFDISIGFADGSTAIISVPKGASGDDAFALALADWAAERPLAAAETSGAATSATSAPTVTSWGALWMRSGSLDRR